MEETLFYVFGLGLVLAALVVSAVGLRSDGFPPSRAVLAGVVCVFALLVGGTTTFGVLSAREEQAHREAELAEADEAEESGEQDGGASAAAPDGATVFDDQGCSGCHALEAAGSTGTTGPNLDEALRGEDGAYIEESIVDPSAELAEGFGDGIMPSTFGDTMTPEELDALVKYLEASTQ